MEILAFVIDFLLLYGPWIIYMLCVPRAVHIFQMEGYKARDYLRWLPKNSKNAFAPGLPQLLACFGFALAMLIMDALLLKFAPVYFSLILTFVQSVMFFVVLATTNIAQVKKDVEKAKKCLDI